MERFTHLMQQIKAQKLSKATNTVAGNVEPPGEIRPLPPKGSQEYERLAAIGKQAYQSSELGILILAGGMATRFNYDHPKGLFPIYQDKSFIELKLRSIQQQAPGVPVHIMTSFHTDAEIREHLAANDNFGLAADQIRLFSQHKLPRLNQDGQPFLKNGEPDYATSGHGDFVECLRESGLLDRFLSAGGRYLLFSNVDNLGATVDFAIVGHHIEAQHAMTVEVASKAPGDKGGAPAKVNGRLQLVEGFAFPKDFNQDLIPVFNTATYVFSAETLTQNFDLPWYVVEKKVDDQTVIQLEHLAGDLSVFLDTDFLLVAREERFLPVKSLEDVPYIQPILKKMNIA